MDILCEQGNSEPLGGDLWKTLVYDTDEQMMIVVDSNIIEAEKLENSEI